MLDKQTVQRFSVAVGLLLAAWNAAIAQPAPATQPYRDWSAYAGGPEQIRYSSLTQINRSNVKQLQVAWQYDTGDVGQMQTEPIIADGLLYGLDPRHRTFAIDAATGQRVWTFNSGVAARGPNRGLMYWADGNDRRIYHAVSTFLYSLDAKTGKPIETFGENGRIDLRQTVDRDQLPDSVGLTTPGVVYKDMLILGSIVSESFPAAPGHIRAFDARTGKRRWIFHTVPFPGEPGYETWPKDAYKYTGGVNNWAGLALDEKRGIVYVPTGSATEDFYGGNRVGDNLYANCLIALDANTGKHLWHYQIVRHDLWDRDLPSPPNLITVHQDGRAIDAVSQTTKHGYVFVFDRVTGKPLFPIEERKVVASDVPGEVAPLTEPAPTKPKPYARQQLTKEMLTHRTPEMHQWAMDEFDKILGGDMWKPLAVGKDTFVFPGFDGGTEWGGSAADPQTGILYVNSNDFAWLGKLAPVTNISSGRSLYLQNCATCHGDTMRGSPPEVPSLVDIGSRMKHQELLDIVRNGAGRMPAFANMQQTSVDAMLKYLTTGEDTAMATPRDAAGNNPFRFTGHRKWTDPEGYFATAPPWGTLNAIDLNTGEYVWTIPFGEYPELVAKGVKNTGSDNYGGPIVTAGGLVFIGATAHDKKFHAYDKATGELLWETTLPFGGVATPATYEINGRQYVVIAAGGGRQRGDLGGLYVAFALPQRP